MSRVREDATAFGKRSATFLLSYDSAGSTQIKTIRSSPGQGTRLLTQDPTPGWSILTFQALERTTRLWCAMHTAQITERLAQIKTVYDPTNLFRMN